jgi:farnesol dehydrogenase
VKLLLVGATGFLGKHVAQRLAEAGHELRVVVRGSSKLDGLPAGAELVRGDVTDADSLKRAAHGCGALFHMAALVKMWVPERERFDEVNVSGFRNVLAAAKAAGARLVYTSSFIAIGPTGAEAADETRIHPGDRYRNDYERSKALADALAREAAAAGDDIVMLYPGVVYGPGDMTDGNLVAQMVRDHMNGRLPGIIGPGDRLWSYAFVEDVAAGHVQALAKGRRGERYLLCGENVTMNALFERLHEVAGVRPPKTHIPYALAALMGRTLWAWAELTGHPPVFTHEVVDVFREHWAYRTDKAERELGYHKTPLEQGLRRTVEWLRESGMA